MGEKRGVRPMISFPWPASVMKNGEMKEMRGEAVSYFAFVALDMKIFLLIGMGRENSRIDTTCDTIYNKRGSKCRNGIN